MITTTTALSCTSCGTKLKRPDNSAVKALKCPKCGSIVRTVNDAPPAASAPAAPAMLTIRCSACPTHLRVRPELAGKAVKCPKCGQVVKVPAPAARPPSPPPVEEEWLDINEAAPPPPAPTKSGTPAGDWGQALLQEHGVPDDMQEQIRKTLTTNERIHWFDRPRMDILMHQARKFQIMGILLGVGGVVGLPLMALFVYNQGNGETGALFGAVVCLFFALILAAIGVYASFAPAVQRKNAARRSCFALTNRRLLIHPGKGTQMFHGRRGGTAIVLGTGKLEIISYSGFELTRLSRIESKRFPGCGELVFNRTLLDEPSGGGLWALSDVRTVEKLFRDKLIHPVIDKLLRGESLSKDEKGDDKQQPAASEDGEAVPPEHRITARLGQTPNARDVRAGVDNDLKKAPAELREQVEQELTAGEKLLWIGQPEGSQKGKAKGGGLLGMATGAEDRREPEYTLYALTNRRVLLWAQKMSNLSSRSKIDLGFGSEPKGPMSYYPSDLRGAGLDDDKAGSGSIVFRQIKVTFKSRVKDQRGNVRNVTHIQMHYLGVLHVRKYLELARLLYDTLIAPCRSL